ncbi:MAG: ABC transporter ATP-binding protein [Solobacterium sp.]|nr:ABC transporter ATP-binding protein [Solobacterium sp.]
MKIVLDHLTKRYPNRTKGEADVIAVNDFNFEIPDGKLIGLLGPSGCGKSTTLNLISGLETATSGKIWFGDDDVTNVPPENRGVGLVFQSYALYPHLTVRQNIMFPLENVKGKDRLTKEQMKEKALEAAKLVQIEMLMDRKPSQLSGGQQQRVAIARALVKLPRVLLLDEPLSNLDARLRLATREEIRRIQTETKLTTVFVTHDQEEAMSISDFIVVMKDGIVQQIGKPQDVYDHPGNLFVAKFLGTPPINVFEGKVENGAIVVNGERILEIEGVEDQDVYVGIRPEGFLLDEKGTFHCAKKQVEVMGRDTSIVFDNPASVSESLRAIITLDNRDAIGDTVCFALKPNKVEIFKKDTEARIDYTVKGA